MSYSEIVYRDTCASHTSLAVGGAATALIKLHASGLVRVPWSNVAVTAVWRWSMRCSAGTYQRIFICAMLCWLVSRRQRAPLST